MQVFDEFLARWTEELKRAVDMFTGEAPALTFSRTGEPLSNAEIGEHTWWKQVVQNDKSFSIWAGAVEPTWTALGEGAEAKDTFLEMLSQANQGTAAVFSAGFPVPLRCETGREEAPTLPQEAELARIAVTFRGSDAGAILLLVERKGFAILDPEEPASAAVENEPASTLSASPAMLSRLLDLRLPVSVLLGRTKISIKEALKLIPGSVVELDRQIGDYVEVIVHGTVVAKGEIVSVKGNYGVRIKEVISRQDRLALHEAA